MCWGAGSAGLTPSRSPQSLLPPSDASLWLAVTVGQVTGDLWAGGCYLLVGSWLFLLHGSLLPILTGLNLWQLGWEVSKTGADENWFYSLTATCSFKTEQVLTSLSLLFWSVTWGQECAWAQPLLIAQPQTWAPPGSLPPPPSALLRASFVVVSAHSGLFRFYVEFCSY